MPKVSVIIPVYNVEKYIERCATSLLSQTLDDIEYIFVDDCTPDGSIEILQKVLTKFPAKAGMVRIERMPANSGQAAVRRHGIQLASSDFIIHCDSDDWVDTDLYEKMYNEAVLSGADVVMCPIRDEYNDIGVTRPMCKHPHTCNEVLEDWYRDSVGMFCWNKLVKRSVYVDNNIEPFEGVNMWEDNGLMLRVFYYAKGLSQIEGSVYHYNQSNAGAITSGYGRNAIDQMIKCSELLGDFFDSKADGYKYQKTVKTLKYLAKLNLVTTRYGWLREYYQLFPESNDAIKWIGLDAFSSKGKIRFLFVKYHLAWLFVTLFKIKTLITNIKCEIRKR